jgi:hypothetical protein
VPSAQLVSDTFRRAASDGVTLASALRDTQKAMIAQPLSHPKAWAGFTLVGDGGQRLSGTRVVGATVAQAGVPAAVRTRSRE